MTQGAVAAMGAVKSVCFGWQDRGTLFALCFEGTQGFLVVFLFCSIASQISLGASGLKFTKPLPSDSQSN